MRELEALSGPWSGFWIQFGVRGTMRLRLQFSGTSLSGGGSDFVGAFTINGFLSPEEGAVQFAKRYATHVVYYRGKWDGTLIAGMWTIRYEHSIEHGEFELWPESGEVEFESIQEAEPLAVGC